MSEVYSHQKVGQFGISTIDVGDAGRNTSHLSHSFRRTARADLSVDILEHQTQDMFTFPVVMRWRFFKLCITLVPLQSAWMHIIFR